MAPGNVARVQDDAQHALIDVDVAKYPLALKGYVPNEVMRRQTGRVVRQLCQVPSVSVDGQVERDRGKIRKGSGAKKYMKCFSMKLYLRRQRIDGWYDGKVLRERIRAPRIVCVSDAN